MRAIASTRFSPRFTKTGDGFRFYAPGQAYVASAFFCFILALCIGGSVGAFTHPHRAFDFSEKLALVLITIGMCALILRFWLAGTLIASPSAFVVRSLLRTRQYTWQGVDHFEEKVAPIGGSGVPRRFLRVHFPDGHFKNLTELNDSTRRVPDPVAELVKRLDEMKAQVLGQPHQRLAH